jgi:4-amino-4-deoxy-L-arabinose transferase-like glycosyltransferase
MSTSPHESYVSRPVFYWVCWSAILLLAVLLRIVPIRSGLPYSDYVDEGHVLHQTVDWFQQRSLDSRWYGYPTFPAYSAGVALCLYDPLYRHFHGHYVREDLPNERDIPHSRLNYNFIAPIELLLAGRTVTACLSIATVILAGMIAVRVANDRAGLLAMLLVAVCPALVTRGSIVIVDTFAAFFALVTLYFCERIQSANEPVWRNAGFAGFATGLAFASKYQTAAVGAAVITSVLLLEVDGRHRIRLACWMVGGFFLGVLAGMPAIFSHPASVWRDVLANIRSYQRPWGQGYFAQAISMPELGWPLLLAGCAGIGLMLRQKKTRIVAISWLLFGAIMIAPYAGKPFQPFRALLPLVPLVCIAAAVAFLEVILWARRKSLFNLHYGLAILLICGCIATLALSSFRQVHGRMAHQDSRVQAVDWLRQNMTNQQRGLAIKELSVLPSEWARIDAKITVVPWLEAAALLHSGAFDYLVGGDFDVRSDPWRSYGPAWSHEISSFKVVATFGTVETAATLGFWRTNDERLIIYRIKP